jgi:hypothetical protein
LGTYIVRRLLQGIPVLLIISAVIFAVVAFIPGDPAAVILGHAATPENIAALRQQMGLDQPLPLGFAAWLSRAIQGDLGNSILSFLGLGAQTPIPSWGADLAAARRYIRDAPWLSLFPGLAIFFLVLALNLCGDGVRDLLDPRRSRR